MKYNENNKPLVCMMTQSTCYKGTKQFTPKGVLWHSTGANNPNLRRYVQPDESNPNWISLKALIGINLYRNDWNHIYYPAGLNFWIGKLADGTVAAVQTMPWNYQPWGVGEGINGSCNETHIQFEICEDSLEDEEYFNACYKEACEMTAYLCKMFCIDPNGTFEYKGIKVPTILDHAGSCKLGLGSNHADIQHWSQRFGKTMDDVRRDVAAILAEGISSANEELKRTGHSESAVQDVTVESGNKCLDLHNKYILSDSPHYISNCGLDENGNIHGGIAGDQTGREWSLIPWYNHPWKVVLRHPNQAVKLKLAELGIDAALNDLIGYDQWENQTYWRELQKAGYEPGKITNPCEADCSSGVCANVRAAGYKLGIEPLQSHNGTFCGNLRDALKNAGFMELTDSRYLTSPDYLLPGDILLNDQQHTVTNITVGKMVQGDWGSAVPEPVGPIPDPTLVTIAETSSASIPPSLFYRVRRSWTDRSSQIGAFTVFKNAKNMVDANPGFAAFDDSGNQVYPAQVPKAA